MSGDELTTKFVLDVNADNVIEAMLGGRKSKLARPLRLEVPRPAIDNAHDEGVRLALDPRRNLTMPGLSATVGEQIAALKRVAGDKVAARIKREPDPFIMGIVDGWPRNFEPKRALQLGFTTAEKTFDDIIRIHIEDELGGKFVG